MIQNNKAGPPPQESAYSSGQRAFDSLGLKNRRSDNDLGTFFRGSNNPDKSGELNGDFYEHGRQRPG